MLVSILSCEPDSGVVEISVLEGVRYLGSKVFGWKQDVSEWGFCGVRWLGGISVFMEGGFWLEFMCLAWGVTEGRTCLGSELFGREMFGEGELWMGRQWCVSWGREVFGEGGFWEGVSYVGGSEVFGWEWGVLEGVGCFRESEVF